jgi:SAM-dependent methyltransferase
MSATSTGTGRAATVLAGISDYYSKKVLQHGASAQGVDWNSEASQALRFEQLLRICGSERPFSLNDLGCGYAGLVDYVSAHGANMIEYWGWDISEAMVEAARRRFAADSRVQVYVGVAPDREADYTVASGIFNVRLAHSDEDWLAHILESLGAMDRFSNRGFAFNCLTKYADRDRMRDYLYYADPCALFDYCKRHFSRNVALLHDYELYEFTILVRKGVQ